MRRFRYLAALPAAAMIVPAAAQVQLQVQGPYVQAASGMTYPEIVDDFRRISVVQYRPDGTDVSAGYRGGSPNAEIIGTVYSFPLPPPVLQPAETADQAQTRQCGAVAAQIVKQVETANAGAQRLQANLVNLGQAGAAQHGYHARYAMTVPSFLSRQQEAVKSDAYVFCYGGKWIVEYRFTYPAAADAAPAIDKFMTDFKWTFAP
jgi:hypothetical protein